MAEPLHIAITRRVRPERLAEFEQALSDFASHSLSEPGMRGVHCIYPPPGSEKKEYGILRSFASEAERDAFYQTPLYQEWLRRIEPLTEGEPKYRQLTGLEAWFRTPGESMPPRWKMALLTWLAVWPVSLFLPLSLQWLFGLRPPEAIGPRIVFSGGIAAGIVVILTWIAMPPLVKTASRWLHASP